MTVRDHIKQVKQFKRFYFEELNFFADSVTVSKYMHSSIEHLSC